MRKNSQDIKTLGILGLGSIGYRHAKNCMAQQVKVFGFDLCNKKLDAAKKVGVITVSRDEIIKNTKNFIICTPSFLHHEDLKFVLKKAKQILIEKPISHNYLLTSNLLKKYKAKNVYTAFNLRFHPVVMEIKKILNSGLLGKIIWSNSIVCSDLKNWRPGTDFKKNYTNNITGGGVINDYSHEIDLINFFFGKSVKVKAFIKNSKTLGLKVEDYSTIVMQNKNNIISSITFDYCCGPSVRKGMIRGVGASLFYDLLNRKLQVTKNTGKIILKKKYKSNFDKDYKQEIISFIKKKTEK